MKNIVKIGTASLILTALVTSCTSGKQSNELTTVDLTQTYPKKELFIQDFTEVEYLSLKTTDEYITQGLISAIGSKYIVVRNSTSDGILYLFDRQTGEPVSKINRLGQGAEEYFFLSSVALDEENNELFVDCMRGRKIQVYDLKGNYKRSLPYVEGVAYSSMRNFDKDHLFIYDSSSMRKDGESRDGKAFHKLLSKADGRVVEEVYLPFEKINSTMVRSHKNSLMGTGVNIPAVVAHQDGCFFTDASTDTVYHYTQESKKLRPFLVKSPTIDPTYFLQLQTVTDDYILFNGVKKEFDFEKRQGFPTTKYVFDRGERTMFEVEVLNADYEDQKSIYVSSHASNTTTAMHQTIEAYELVEAYENGQLKGRLKELASTLEEESNPVIMLLNYK